jgi:hypothetical protein
MDDDDEDEDEETAKAKKAGTIEPVTSMPFKELIIEAMKAIAKDQVLKFKNFAMMGS